LDITEKSSKIQAPEPVLISRNNYGYHQQESYQYGEKVQINFHSISKQVKRKIKNSRRQQCNQLFSKNAIQHPILFLSSPIYRMENKGN
jgi:hypothetical protein